MLIRYLTWSRSWCYIVYISYMNTVAKAHLFTAVFLQLTIFTADCLRHNPIQMVGIENILLLVYSYFVYVHERWTISPCLDEPPACCMLYSFKISPSVCLWQMLVSNICLQESTQYRLCWYPTWGSEMCHSYCMPAVNYVRKPSKSSLWKETKSYKEILMRNTKRAFDMHRN